MPIANRCVEPVYVSQVKVPQSVENEFEYIVNATLSNFIKQIACLTIKAKDIFDELTVSLTHIVDRSIILENKIDFLTTEVQRSDGTIMKPLVGTKIEVYKTFINRDDELLDHTEMPDSIREMFAKAYPPPELYKFDEYRKDGTESLRSYTDPEFFLREWLKNVRVEKKKKKEKRRKKSIIIQKENLPQLPPVFVNPVVQEFPTEQVPNPYNYVDEAIYEHPFRSNNDAQNNLNELNNMQERINLSELPPPPPPPPPPPLPPPPPASVPAVTSPIIRDTNAALPPAPKMDSIQNLLRDIQKGTLLKPVSAVKSEDKRKTKDFRAMIAELRPAWDNNSESEDESDDDSFDSST